MKILITGSAGFIGFHLSQKLLGKNQIIGIDNFNQYYDNKLKKLSFLALRQDLVSDEYIQSS